MFHPPDTWCKMQCIMDREYNCLFLNCCGYRKKFIYAMRRKQSFSMKRYQSNNWKYDRGDNGYVNLKEMISLARVYLMTGFVCWYCGEKMMIGATINHPQSFTVDHRKSLGSGGGNSLDNFVYCCSSCNQTKSMSEM